MKRIGLVVLLAAATQVRAQSGQPEDEKRGHGDMSQKVPYVLDGLPRDIQTYREHPCPVVDTVIYPGRDIHYEPEALVHIAFVSKLAVMEEIAAEVAKTFYGRAPSSILLMASYQCRKTKLNQRNLSEHALGNAVDIGGFVFDAIDPADLPEGASVALAQPLRVTVVKHWKASDPISKVHQAFLHAWVERVIAREDLFRVVLGPGYPGHHNHLHFDAAPYQLVSLSR